MGYKIIKYFVRYLLDHNSKQANYSYMYDTHFLIQKDVNAVFIRSISDPFPCLIVSFLIDREPDKISLFVIVSFFREFVKITSSFCTIYRIFFLLTILKTLSL